MSKGALLELIRASPAKFERMSINMPFTEKNVVSKELDKRAKILGDFRRG